MGEQSTLLQMGYRVRVIDGLPDPTSAVQTLHYAAGFHEQL
jgi:hypothetical protein